jgi:hypothetical protein
MSDGTRRLPPTPEETLAGLARSEWSTFDGTVSGFESRETDFLVLVRHSRIEGEVGAAFLWPDADLTGHYTGEPQHSLDEWVVEIGLDLDEFFGTEPLWRVQGQLEERGGIRVVRRYGRGA